MSALSQQSGYLESWGKKVKGIQPHEFDVCLYHAGCPDGVGGAFPFWRLNDRGRNIEIKPINHYDSYPKNLVRGKKVVMVDICFKRENILRLCRDAEVVVVLDHHDTSRRSIEGTEKIHDNIGYVFDMKRSGAQISWNWCYPLESNPWFIDIIADRDLWEWRIPNSRLIGRALYHFEWYTFQKMEELYTTATPLRKLKETFIAQGRLLHEIETKDISYSVGNSVLCDFTCVGKTYRVRLTACHPTIRSEVGNTLANFKDCHFAATWRYDFQSDQWWISFRGAKDSSLKLNRIAEKFGGGGHPKACGFSIHGNNSKDHFDKDVVTGTLWDYFKIV